MSAILYDKYKSYNIKFSALWLMILCFQVFLSVYIISVGQASYQLEETYNFFIF